MSIAQTAILLNAALEYAQRGLAVFPLQPRGKKPITAHGLKDATKDESIIRAWWGRNPNANIGIRCDGLLVLDFDGYEGQESLNRLEEQYGKVPSTWMIKTGGGTEAEPKEQGIHFVFQCPPELNVRPGAGKYGYQNLDIRSNDSYIVAAPSVTRLPYETIDPSPIANAPEWLVAIAKAGKRSKASDETGSRIPQGQNDAWLTSRAGAYRHKGDTEEQIIEKLRIDALRLDQNPARPYQDTDFRRIAKSVCRYPAGEATTKPPTPKSNGQHASLEPTVLNVRNMSSVYAVKVGYLWFPYIPFGKLSLLEGDPGIGKSWVALSIATAYSLGIALPNDMREPESGVILIASAEDGLADTIRPRLDAMGADVSQIHAIDGLFTLNDSGFQLLEDAIANNPPGLVIIDPLVAYLSGDLDINKANQARYATSRLAALAEKYNAAVLAIRHLTKGGGHKAIYRGLGSIDFTAAARSVLMAGSDADDSTNTGIVHIKSNLAPKGEPVGYELREGNFYWKQTCDLTAEKIMAANDTGGSQLEEAIAFLREILGPGDLPAKDIFDQARIRGFSTATINRAKAKIGIDAYHQGNTGAKGGGKWYWKMPEVS